MNYSTRANYTKQSSGLRNLLKTYTLYVLGPEIEFR